MSNKGKRYSEEFKLEVIKRVLEQGKKIIDVSHETEVHQNTIGLWISKYKHQKGKDSSNEKTIKEREIAVMNKELDRVNKELDRVNKELIKTKEELVQVKKNNETLEKAAAYFTSKYDEINKRLG